MAASELHDQRVFFVVTPFGFASVLDYSGEGVKGEIEYSADMRDHLDTVPKVPGFYVWEGSIWIDDGQSSGGEPSDADVRWYGAFKKAPAADIIRFAARNKDSEVAW